MSNQRASEQSESNQRTRKQSDFIIPSEPKILRLVIRHSSTHFSACFDFSPNHEYNRLYILQRCAKVLTKITELTKILMASGNHNPL